MKARPPKSQVLEIESIRAKLASAATPDTFAATRTYSCFFLESRSFVLSTILTSDSVHYPGGTWYCVTCQAAAAFIELATTSLCSRTLENYAAESSCIIASTKTSLQHDRAVLHSRTKAPDSLTSAYQSAWPSSAFDYLLTFDYLGSVW